MRNRRVRSMLGGLLTIALVAISCSERTETTPTSASTPTGVDRGLRVIEDPASATPAPAAPAPVDSSENNRAVETVTREGWINHDAGAFSLDIPTSWAVMTRPAQVAPVIDAATEAGAEFPRQAPREFEQLLEHGNAIIGVGERGNNVNAFRQFGVASALARHKEIADALALQFSSFATDITFTSEPRLFGENPGVLVRGSYLVDGEKLHMYQFQTHRSTYLYLFTITLFAGDDPALATELFRSIRIG